MGGGHCEGTSPGFRCVSPPRIACRVLTSPWAEWLRSWCPTWSRRAPSTEVTGSGRTQTTRPRRTSVPLSRHVWPEDSTCTVTATSHGGSLLHYGTSQSNSYPGARLERGRDPKAKDTEPRGTDVGKHWQLLLRRFGVFHTRRGRRPLVREVPLNEWT